MRRAIPFLLVGQAGVSGQFYMGKNDRGRMSIARKKRHPPNLRDLNRIERQLDRSFLRRRAVRGDPVLASASSIQTGA
jgi:hypothetical protein